MEKLDSIVSQAEILVNKLVCEIEHGEANLQDAEQRVQQFVNRIGGMITGEIVERVAEPTGENTIYVDGQPARHKERPQLRLKRRFGNWIERSRRRYAIGGGGSYYPLDERLGVNMCGGFTPLLTYLLTLFGASEPYEATAKRLSAALGFEVSATALQTNTERVGKRLESRPQRVIESHQQREPSELMVVEIDGTLSPQIREQAGVCGRESMREPTEYKECNLVAIEKHRTGRLPQRWLGGRYGARGEFEPYLRESALAMGQEQAEQVVFLADGARHNWELQQTNFPEAVPILDVYHALGHLGEFCALFRDQRAGKQHYARWREQIYAGAIVAVLGEMKEALPKVSDRPEAQKHINYFATNQDRVAYDVYRAKGYPIGSGMVEGAAKYVVGKRFKGSGMRWKRADNEAVLNARLHLLNETIEYQFREQSTSRSFRTFHSRCQVGAARA